MPEHNAWRASSRFVSCGRDEVPRRGPRLVKFELVKAKTVRSSWDDYRSCGNDGFHAHVHAGREIRVASKQALRQSDSPQKLSPCACGSALPGNSTAASTCLPSCVVACPHCVRRSRRCLHLLHTPTKACADLLTATAIRKGSMDNTSAMVVDLRGLFRGGNDRAVGSPRFSNRLGNPAVSSRAGGASTTLKAFTTVNNKTSVSRPQFHRDGVGSGGSGETDMGASGSTSAGTSSNTARPRPSTSMEPWNDRVGNNRCQIPSQVNNIAFCS